MSEFVGIEEGWVERGWTRKQMRERIEELGLTVNSWCVLQPYELNFMQNPDANQEIEEDVESGERAIGVEKAKLWTPGETITVTCEKTTLVDNFESTVKKYVMQDVQPYVSVKFKFVPSGGKVTSRVIPNGTGGGSTAIGKGSGTHTISFPPFFFKKSDKFDYTRFIIVHEFGHVLGLYHEFARDQCKQAGVTCTDEDPLSVMNFPIGTTSPFGSGIGVRKETMDHFSPKDIKWLKSVYG
jgi:hypothetical protein